MSNKKTSFFSGGFEKLAYRLSIVFALIVPLADTLLLSPLCGILLANVGDGVLYEIISKLSELLVTVAFLAQCAVIVCAVFAGQNKLAAKLFWIEGLSFVFIAVFLKSGVLWLSAVIDEYLLSELGTFALSNYTLSQINDELLVWWSMISYFMNVIMLTFVMTAGFFAAKLKVRSVRATGRKLSHEALVAGLPKNAMINRYVMLPAIVYLVAQMVFCVTDTLDTVAGYGTPALVSEYLFIIMPYVYQIGFVIVSCFVCQYIAYAMVSRLDKNC